MSEGDIINIENQLQFFASGVYLCVGCYPIRAMRYFQIYQFAFLLFVLNVPDNSNTPSLNNSRKAEDSFKLIFNRVGLGPNMYELQPAFRVRNNSFCFTNEEASIFDKKIKPAKDTLYSGVFRTTSVDSIKSILLKLKTDKIDVYKRYLDGAIGYLEVTVQKRKYSFKMDNTSDTTAQKIIDILNTYIPDETMRIRLLK